MKNRFEITLEWDCMKFDRRFNKQVGLNTNLPTSMHTKGKNAPRIEEITVTSSNGETDGQIYITLDQYIGSDYRGIDPTETAIHKLLSEWYDKHVTSGSSGLGSKYFQTEFDLSRKENSFCQSALWRVVAILESLGIEKSQLPEPKVSYRKYIRVPKNKAWENEFGLEEWGWVELGKILSTQLRLGSSPLLV